MPKTITVSVNFILVSLTEFLKSYNTKYEMSILINSPENFICTFSSSQILNRPEAKHLP